MQLFRLQRLYIPWLIALGALLWTPAAAWGLSAQLTVDSEQLATDESIQMAIAVDGAAAATRPQIAAPNGLSIQYLGPSTQVQIVNGKYSAAVTYNYVVSAVKPGQYTLGPFRVHAGSKTLTTNAVTLQVTGSGGNPGPAATPGAQSADDGSAAADQRGNQLWIELKPAKNQAYLGEKIPIKIRLWVRDVRVEDLSYPVLNQTEVVVGKFAKPIQKKVVRNGLAYQMVEFASTVTPVKTGHFDLGPATLDAVVRVQSRDRDPFFDDFFDDDSGSKQNIQLKTKPVSFSAQQLPGHPPADFSGGVGQFQLKVSAAPLQCLQGDPVTVKLQVSGAGNLDAIAAPVLADKSGLKVYDPQRKSLATQASSGGSAVFEQVLIPTEPGQKRIGPFTFRYFDPASGRFQKLVSAALPLTVQANPNYRAASPAAGGGDELETVGKDLLFIKETPGALRPLGAGVAHNPGFWLLQLLPLLALAGALGYRRRQNALRSDSPQARVLRARRRSERNLQQAQRLLDAGQLDELLELLCTTLREAIGAQYDLPAAGITEAVTELLQNRGVPAETLAGIKAFFDSYDFFRFTGSKLGSEDARRLLGEVRRLTKAIENQNGSGFKASPPVRKVI